MEAEHAEQHLQLAPETAVLAEEMAQIVLETIRRFAPAAGQLEARDVIAKGMINAAALADEAGGAALIARVERAIRGYLRETASNSAEICAASSAAP
ncbi:hypothetical protein [Leisingera sp. ANG-M7]|uniref:hypothetical protein n=1 Tax=Leisingera sp. ANG-M7 TaxID=1577902 RepID=UPI00057FABAD|nr:hypothetical protein [Leisingera sp. ANG-M7]KIC38311.1 hypothetical protein RA26_04950 [Leisingera sp. ANG-M7]